MTNQPPNQAPALPIVKGSWEDLLLQAQQLATKQDDAAIPIFRKLVDRLGGLPAKQRAAANGRLNEILVRAAVDYQFYLSIRDLYDEALAVNTFVRPLIPEAEHTPWDRHAAAMRIQAGQVAEGLATMRDLAASGDLDQWGDVLFASVYHEQFTDAALAISGAEARLNQAHSQQFTSEEAKRDQAFVAYLKARLALAQGQATESVAWYEHAMMLDNFYLDNPQYLYTHLMDAHAYGEAQPLIRRDQKNPIRAGFWQGLLYKHNGQPADAERQWRKVIQAELPEEGAVDYLEFVLSHFYLGDREATGLGSVLRAANKEPEFWGLFYLAGLGWAMRDDMVAARSDMQLALIRRKSMAEGRKLARNWWQFCADLLDEDKQAQLVEFFDNAQIQRPT